MHIDSQATMAVCAVIVLVLGLAKGYGNLMAMLSEIKTMLTGHVLPEIKALHKVDDKLAERMTAFERWRMGRPT